jgi:2-polyprenyl-3-methyl-5-hydroxy-6-metoxy-1,4-benzoquinol methylase
MARVDRRYLDGTYESEHPDWHEADARWKAGHSLAILRENGVIPTTVCDIGCGTGGVLRSVVESGSPDLRGVGFEVSERIVELASSSPSEHIEFRLWQDRDPSVRFDVALLMDVIEHVPDYLGFLEEIRGCAERYVFHIPLDMNAQGVARQTPVMHARETVGHLHYFSRRTALASLEYAGYEIVDWSFTPSWETVQEKSLGRSAFDRFRASLFRRIPERTVDVLGGYSLMVLANGSSRPSV